MLKNSVMNSQPSRLGFGDLFFLSVLIWYVVAGMMLAPFHGDEASTIYQAKDWYRIFVQRDLSNVLYREKIDDPRQADEQEFRLPNGVISKYAIGLFSSLIGQPIEAMNDPWFWGADYPDNQAHGHIPKPVVLLAGRFSSTAMVILSLAFVFRIGWQLRGRLTAWSASFVYATLPSVLLNGRRAMFEGATLIAIVLVISAGISLMRLHRQYPERPLWRNWVLFGLACGFAMAAKHSLLIIIAPVSVMLLLLDWRSIGKTLIKLTLAGVSALALFLLLNPAWWSAPLHVPAQVLRIRGVILQIQVDIFGGYQNTLDRVAGLGRFSLGSAQYFEDKQNWNAWIGDQIAAYEASRLGGIDWNGWLAYLLMAIGVAALVRSRRPVSLLVAFTAIVSAGAILLATPLPWQRYYLLLAALWAILIGVGADILLRVVWSRRHVLRKM